MSEMSSPDGGGTAEFGSIGEVKSQILDGSDAIRDRAVPPLTTLHERLGYALGGLREMRQAADELCGFIGKVSGAVVEGGGLLAIAGGAAGDAAGRIAAATKETHNPDLAQAGPWAREVADGIENVGGLLNPARGDELDARLKGALRMLQEVIGEVESDLTGVRDLTEGLRDEAAAVADFTREHTEPM